MPGRAHTFRKPAAGKMLVFGRWEHFKRPFRPLSALCIAPKHGFIRF